MIHETARSYLLDPENESQFAFDERSGYRDLAMTCLHCLLDTSMRAPRSRRPSIRLQNTAHSPLLHYAAFAFYEHVNIASSSDQDLFLRLHEFLASPYGNVLSWIEYVFQQEDLNPLVRTGAILKTYMKRRSKYLPSLGERSRTMDLWSTDLIRLTAIFGQNLRSFTPSIFYIIPPLCPHESALYQQFGNSPRGMSVHGLASPSWDDRLACMIYHNRETTALICGDIYFAIGTSDKNITLHCTSTCQCVATLNHDERMNLLEFSVSGKLLASAGHECVRVWNMGTRKFTLQLKTTRSCLAMTFTPDSKKMILAC